MAVSPNDQDRLDVLGNQLFCIALDLLAQVVQSLVATAWNFLDRLPELSGRREKFLRQCM
jgi:hypothetical protein